MIKIPKPSNSRLGENQKECQKICETECQGRQQDHSLRDDCFRERWLNACSWKNGKESCAVHAGSIKRLWLYWHKGKISLCDLGVIWRYNLWTFAAPVYIQPVSWLLQGYKQKFVHKPSWVLWALWCYAWRLSPTYRWGRVESICFRKKCGSFLAVETVRLFCIPTNWFCITSKFTPWFFEGPMADSFGRFYPWYSQIGRGS